MMKKIYFIIIFSALVLITLLICCVFVETSTVVDSLHLATKIGEVKRECNVFEKNNKYYFFLPAGASYDIKDLSCCDGYTISTESVGEDEYLVSIIDPLHIIFKKVYVTVMKSNKVSSLHISLKKGKLEDINSDTVDEIHSSDKTKLSGHVSLIDENGLLVYDGEMKSLSGRGNSSWGMQKKPYTLKMKEICNLVEKANTKDYVLVANGCDDSSLRNKIVYDAAIAAGLKYSPKTDWVDLYVDGDYIGLYLITTQIHVSEYAMDLSLLEERTAKKNAFSLSSYGTYFESTPSGIMKGYNIPSNPEDITGGYLLEFELPDRVNKESNIFETHSGQNISIKYPSAVSREQMQYIMRLVDLLEKSMGSDDIYDYIDKDSWVDYYLIQEIFANDSQTSYFFYKDSDSVDEKIYAGPVWDYDLTLGTAYSYNRKSPQSFAVNTWGWFNKIYPNQTFKDSVCERFSGFYRSYTMSLIIALIDEYCEKIHDSYQMDRIRWQGTNVFEYCDHFDTLEQHADSIKHFIDYRLEFLDKEWGDGSYQAKQADRCDTDSSTNNSKDDFTNDNDSALIHYIKVLYHHPEPYITYLVIAILVFFTIGLIVYNRKHQ